MVAQGVKYAFALLGFLFIANAQGLEACPIQKFEQDAAIVSEHCPIGRGLWSNKPSATGEMFWVQCGMFDGLPSKAFQQDISKHVGKAGNWVLKPETSGYRCLIGPYLSFDDANVVRSKVRQETVMSDAFIRQISPNDKKAPNTSNALNASVVSAKTATSVSTQPNKTAGRKLDPVMGLWAPKPQGNDARYTVHRRDWWRATYSDAKKACTQSGKRLATESAIRRAVERQGTQAKLPTTIPYWLNNGNVYDIKLDMAFVAISDTLTLNVLCE